MGDGLNHLFCDQHALGPTEATKRGVGHRVGATAIGSDSNGRIEVRVVGVEHGSIIDRIRKIPREPTAGGQVNIGCQDAPFIIKTDMPAPFKFMALAGHQHVIVTIEAALHCSACFYSCQRGQGRPLRGLRLLTAKSAAHTPYFHSD